MKVFTSTESAHVHEVVTASREGGARSTCISGLVAGNFCAYWMGIVIVGLMAIAFGICTLGLGACSRSQAACIDPGRCSPSAWWPSASWAWAR